MPRYSMHVSERYDDEEDDGDSLHRIGGTAIGLATSDWPRCHGRPMQHALTIDLAQAELEVPGARAGARAVSVFVDSYYDLDVGSCEGITVVWLDQAQIDALPQTRPPADFTAEKLPGHEMVDAPMLELVEAEEDDEDVEFGDSYLGGVPRWGDAGEPAHRPSGSFVMQIMSHDFPVARVASCMFVFEDGACIEAEHPG